MDPLLDGCFSKTNSGLNPKPVGATLQGALAVAAALWPAGVPSAYAPKGNNAALACWRRVIKLFADEVGRVRVRFSSGHKAPDHGVWVLGREAPHAVVVSGRRFPMPLDDDRRRLVCAIWTVLKGHPPLEVDAAAASLAAAIMRRMIARANRPPPVRVRDKALDACGLSRWFDEMADGMARAKEKKIGMLPLCMAPPKVGSSDYLPPGEDMGHLSAFRAAVALRRSNDPIADINRALGVAHSGKLVLGDFTITMSENKFNFRPLSGVALDVFRDRESTKFDTLMEGLRRLDDDGSLTLDPFMRRLAEMPDPARHAAAVRFMLQKRSCLGWLCSHGASAKDWLEAAAAEGLPPEDLKSCWTVAFGRGAWDEFAKDYTLARQRFNGRAVLRRTPFMDDGLLVYPALPRPSPGMSHRNRHEVRVGHMTVAWVRSSSAGWTLVLQCTPQRSNAGFDALRMTVGNIGGGMHKHTELSGALREWVTENAEEELYNIMQVFGSSAKRELSRTFIVTDSPAVVIIFRIVGKKQVLENMFIKE